MPTGVLGVLLRAGAASLIAASSASEARLVRREGVAIGHRQRWELGEAGLDGRTAVDVRTLSLQPLVFEVENFLSEAEADHIMALAEAEGMGDSYTLASTATKDRFRINDYNKDGVLDVQELILMIDGLVDAHVSAEDVELMVERLGMDPDGDGRVAKQHLAAPVRILHACFAFKGSYSTTLKGCVEAGALDAVPHTAADSIADEAQP